MLGSAVVGYLCRYIRMSSGRPPFAREPLYEAICRLPRAGLDLRNVSARSLSRQLNVHRATVGVMLDDLEQAGRVRRLRGKGPRGTLVRIVDTSYRK